MQPNHLWQLYQQITNPIVKSPHNTYYILSNHFIADLQRAAQSNKQVEPSNIINQDFNKHIIDHYQQGYPILVESLREGRDYRILSEPTFKNLIKHFKGTPLPRKWQNVMSRTLIYQQSFYIVFTRKDNFKFIVNIFCHQFLRQRHSPHNLNPHSSVELWVRVGPLPINYSKLTKMSVQIETLFPSDFLVLNPQLYRITRKFKKFNFILLIYDQDPLIPRPILKCRQHQQKRAIYCCLCLHERTYSCSQHCFRIDRKHMAKCIYASKIYQVEPEKTFQKGKGLAGLYNQLNMCFFNTALQCFAHTEILNRYFFQHRQKKDLNYWNKDGTFGQIGLLYGTFLRNLWQNKQKPDLKINMPLFQAVSRWYPVYARKNQQDAHQFIVRLLDWLKQDLNLNQDKPCYRQLQQLSSQTEALASALKYLRQRSQSIIEDIFCSTLRSKIVCLQCKATSTTFDNCLTVQLPVIKPQRRQVHPVEVNIFYHQFNLNQIYKLTMMLLPTQPLGEVKKRIRCQFPSGKSYEIGLFIVTMNRGFRNVQQTQQMMNLQSDQAIYCIEKFRIGLIGLVQIKMILEQQQTSCPGTFKNTIFQRPIYLPAKTQPRSIYQRILQYVFCRINKSNIINSHTFLTKNLQARTFPFTVFLKYSKNGSQYQEYLHLQDDTPNQLQLQSGYQMIVKLRQHQNLEYKGLISYSRKRQKFSPPINNTFKISELKLEDCIQAFCQKQALSGWECPKCHDNNKAASKTITFQKLPKILILSLNRFRKDFTSLQQGVFHKNQAFIKYPQELLLKSQQNKQSKYKLYALANHIKLGETRQNVNQIHGHYHAYVKVENRWYKFDDDLISPIYQSQAFKSQDAYILFYQLLS